MKKIIAAFTFLMLITSCANQKKDTYVTIKGKDLTGKLKEIHFIAIKDNPILYNGLMITALVDSSSVYNVDIPIVGLASGRMDIGGLQHKVCFLPGDDMNIEIGIDTLFFSGKGAEKNSFLYALEKNGIAEQSIASLYRNDTLTSEEFLNRIKDFKQKRIDFLNSFPNIKNLETEFVDYYKVETQVLHENQIQRYGNRRKTLVDSDTLSNEISRLNWISNFMDDEKVISDKYLNSISQFVGMYAENMIQSDSTLNRMDAYHTIVFDSLKGKTLEYILARNICSGLGFNYYDTIYLNRFNEIEKDILSTRAVNRVLDKYNEKQDLIGRPIHIEFAETLLADTANNQITFGEMMGKFKGSVVYLDMWALSCGPCRASKPYEIAMQERLSDLPIEIVYITGDHYSQDLWGKIFDVSLTRKNHYRFINNHDSRLAKFMDIYFDPCYMIFDKEGKLVDFMADRPSKSNKGDSKLEITLKELANK